MVQQEIKDQFHKLYTDSFVTRDNTYWLNIPVVKTPLDCWIYQEIISKIKPDIIIECGTWKGGSALFLASVCSLLGEGLVITIDVAPMVTQENKHPGVVYLIGSSVSQDIVDKVRVIVGQAQVVMVILDSDHSKAHVLKEMNIYSEFVSVGSYLIVEDTNVNGHPIWPHFGPGPYEAVQEFLSTRDDFVVDKSKEKFHLTYNPDGYLKRVK